MGGWRALDNLEGIAGRVRRSRARRGGRGIRPARAIANGNMPRCEVDDRGRNKERRNLARPALHQFPVLALDDVEPADSRGNVNTHFIQVRISRLPIGRLDREIRSGQRHLNEAAHLLQFFFLDPLEGVEVFDLASNLAIKSSGVKLRDEANTAAPGHEVFPAFLRADTQRADQSNARNNYPASQLYLAPM